MSAGMPHTSLSDLPPVTAPPVSAIAQFKTEDDTPVDNIFSEKQQRLFTEPLYASWAGPDGSRKFVAMANVGLFYAVKKPPVVPDGLLSVGVEAPDDMWQREHRSYFVWDYGQSPDVVIETVSNTEGDELGGKLRYYREAGVAYYVVWDPNRVIRKERLLGFRLTGGDYQPITDLWFERIGLGLRIWHGIFEGKEADWLRWCDQNGEVIPTGAERAEQERQRAEQERQRAEQERQRAERLVAQLRSLGKEPIE